MPRSTAWAAGLLAGLLLLGCSAPAPTSPSGAKPKSTAKATPPAASKVTLTGQVMAPAGVISAGGGNVVSAGGLNWRHVLAVDVQALGGTRVRLLDGQGKAVAGTSEVKTDASGQYTVKVPANGTYVVVADAKTEGGEDASFKSLVKVGTASASADIDPSTTVVTALMLKDLAGKLDALDNGRFDKACAAVMAKMTSNTMPDWSSESSILTMAEGFAQDIAELKTFFKDMAEAVPAAREGLEEADKELDRAQEELEKASSIAGGIEGLEGLGGL